MIRTTAYFSCRFTGRVSIGAAAWLALMMPMAVQAQAQTGGFSLPQPSPTPTPRPEGPADERAGVAIPPRSVPAPQIVPEPVLVPERTPQQSPQSAPTPNRVTGQSPQPSAPRAVSSSPAPASSLSQTPDTAPTADTAPELAAPTLRPDLVPAQPPLPSPAQSPAPSPAPASAPVSSATWFTLPIWWPWAVGGLIVLALLGAGALVWRKHQRKPRVPRLAPPLIVDKNTSPGGPIPPERASAAALGINLDIIGATRSMMMFTLQYRLTLANRAGHAVNDVAVAIDIACARHGANNGVSPGAAQQVETITRIGPHQTRAIIGELQLPLSQIAPLRQGSLTLFIPLIHVTLQPSGNPESQPALARSFVIGTPSASGSGRLHPIRLDIPPGSIPGLRAQSIIVPTERAVSAAA